MEKKLIILGSGFPHYYIFVYRDTLKKTSWLKVINLNERSKLENMYVELCTAMQKSQQKSHNKPMAKFIFSPNIES